MNEEMKEQFNTLDTLVIGQISKMCNVDSDWKEVKARKVSARLNELYMRQGYGAGTPYVHNVFNTDMVRSVAERCMCTGFDADEDTVFLA